MIQYYLMDEISIKNSSNEVIKVKDFRKRLKYDLKNVFITKPVQDELIRPDVLSSRIYSDPYKVNGIIDVNDKDIFSFQLTDEIRFVTPERL